MSFLRSRAFWEHFWFGWALAFPFGVAAFVLFVLIPFWKG